MEEHKGWLAGTVIIRKTKDDSRMLRNLVSLAFGATLLMAFLACSSSAEMRATRDLDAPATRNVQSAAGDEADHQETCIPLWPARVRLSGTIAEELKYGPPGYGENPKTDRRLHILVLRLKEPVDVCADTSRVAPQALVRRVQSIQLTEQVSENVLRRHLGVFVEVFGTLRRRVWPNDFTEALIRVDSIPALQLRFHKSA
jgi:hypothetical protein